MGISLENFSELFFTCEYGHKVIYVFENEEEIDGYARDGFKLSLISFSICADRPIRYYLQDKFCKAAVRRCYALNRDEIAVLIDLEETK